MGAPRHPVGTRCGDGWMRGPCACPCRGTSSGEASTEPAGIVGRAGQAQGPHPSPHPPPVPTGRRGADVFWYSLMRLVTFIIGDESAPTRGLSVRKLIS